MVDGPEHVVARRDVTIYPDGRVQLSEFKRNGRFSSDPLVSVSQETMKVGDWAVGDNFERLIDPFQKN